MKKEGIELQEIFSAIRKRIGLLIVIVFLCTSALVVYGLKIKKPHYTGTVKIFSGKDIGAENYTVDELESNTILIQTYIELIRTDNFMESVIEKSGVKNSPEGLKGAVNFESDGKTPILTISYRDSSSEITEKVMLAITENFEREVKETILNINTKVIEDVKVVENKPNISKLTIIGFGMGIILGIGVILILAFLDNRIKTKEDIEDVLSVPVLVEIPKIKELSKFKKE